MCLGMRLHIPTEHETDLSYLYSHSRLADPKQAAAIQYLINELKHFMK